MAALDEIPTWPARVVTGALLLLGLLVSPPVISHVTSLQWQVGDLSPVAIGMTSLCMLLSLLGWLNRDEINRRCHIAFPTRRKLLFAVTAMGISCVATLLLTEVALRVLKFPFSGSWTPSENGLAQFDPELGWSYLPNKSVSQAFGPDLPPVAMHFNKRGIRVAKPEVVLRPEAPSALFVGGSFTMGHGLEFEDTFIGQLQAFAGFPLQVVNLGVQGFGTDQSLLQLQRHIDDFNTKAVVYTFMYDHVRRNANHDRRILFPKGRFLGTKPVFGINADGQPILRRQPALYEEVRFLWLWGALQGAWAHWGPEPTNDLTRALVQRMKELTESRGAAFLVIEWNQGGASSIDPKSPFAGMELELIDTAVDAPAGWDTWKIPGDTHPDKQASQRVARLLYDRLQQAGVLSDVASAMPEQASR